MKGEDGFDELLAALAALPAHDASAERTERARSRCLGQLEGARRRRAPGAQGLRPVWLEAAVVAFSAAYLAAAVQLSVVFLRAVR
jgi:hypothetical protein